MNTLSKAVLVLLFAGTLQAPGLSQPVDAESKRIRRSSPPARNASHTRHRIAAQFDCLPEGFTLADVVSYTRKSKDSEGFITIKDKLAEFRARCKSGKL